MIHTGDGHALYTPGLSESRDGASRYYAFDRLGNLWTVDGSSKSQLYYQDSTAFGALFAAAGTGTPFGFGGGNGCETDADTGLVLMGHRYYDPRTGRFLSQDPAGAGDNWYAYADNSPTNNTDPTGLVIAGGGWGGFVPDASQANVPFDPSQNDTSDYLNGDAGTYNEYINGVYQGTKTVGGLWDQMNNPTSGGAPGAGLATDAGAVSAMRMPKPLLRALLTGVLGGLSSLLPGSHGAGQKAPEPQSTPPAVEQNVTKKKPSGSEFSLQNFQQYMRGVGRAGGEIIDELGGAIRRQQDSGVSIPIGGGASSALE